MRTVSVGAAALVVSVGLVLSGCGSSDKPTSEQTRWAQQQCVVSGLDRHDDAWSGCVEKFEKQAKDLQDAGLELK